MFGNFQTQTPDPIRDRELIGAGNRTRTGTLLTARDFKSLVSTDFTMPATQLF